ncbi:MAG TPA: PQQ-binding-like beta-propeller repeat protein [Fervidobacterium sp.]|nr:PQQ-binding-like beta-propeller repeat protein [Fervidobacterium sp.]HPT54526.1 PQQ-binding-like beta-propeller repeat protein [Fervidobacterium sp.]HPZ18014.1 PQQ-binding-like beta-propeller repeat protein [Fervidobacterium sp.]
MNAVNMFNNFPKHMHGIRNSLSVICHQSIAALIIILTLLSFQITIPAVDFVPFGHRDVVWRLATDNKNIYSVSADGTLKIWTQALLLEQGLPTHSSWARAVAVSDKYVAVGGYKPDNMIKIYEKSTLKLVKSLTAHTGSIFSLAFYKDMLISGGSDNRIIVWKDFAPVKTLVLHNGWIRELFVASNLLISGDENGRIVITNLTNFSTVKVFEIGEMVTSMHGTANEVFVGTTMGSVYKITLSQKKIEKLIDKNIQQRFGNQGLSPSYSIGSIFCTDDQLFISVEGTVFVYNLKSGKTTYSHAFDASETEITSLILINGRLFVANRYGEIFAYNIDGRYITKSSRHYYSSAKVLSTSVYLVIARETGELEAYDKNSSKLVWKTNIGKPIRSLSVVGSGHEEVILVGSNEGNVYFLRNGRTIRSVKLENAVVSLLVDTDRIYAGTFGAVYLITESNVQKIFSDPDEWNTSIFSDKHATNLVYIGTNTGRIYALNTSKKTSEKIAELQDFVIRIIRNEKSLIAATFTGKIYNFASKKVEVLPQRSIYDVFYKNGMLFIAGQSLNCKYVDRDVNKTLIEFEAPLVSISAQESENNYLFVGLSNGQVLQLEIDLKDTLPSAKIVRRFSPELAKISAITVDDSREVIVCGHEDGKLSVWEREGKTYGNYKITKILEDHLESVKRVLVYGDYVISASSDNTVKIWNLTTGKLIVTLMGHSSYVWALYIVDSKLISGDWNGKLIIWNIKDVYNVYKERDIQIGLSITDIWADTINEIYLSTLEGYAVKISGNSIKKLKLAKETLWTIDGDSLRVYTAGWDGNLYILNRNLEVLNRYKTHSSTVFKIAIYRDNIITAGSDNLIKVWKIKVGIDNKSKDILTLEKTFSDFRQSILTIALSKKTGKIITTDGDSIIEIEIGLN